MAGVRVDRHRAAAAADLAALAGARRAAEGEERCCAVAREVATANGSHLVACALTALVVEVSVRVPTRTWPGSVTAHARASPAAPPSVPSARADLRRPAQPPASPTIPSPRPTSPAR